MQGNKIKVLAIEDSPFQAEILANKLASGGYEVIGPFNNGEKALSHVESLEEKPQVAVLDIQINGAIDGIDTAKALHKKHGTSIVFLSHMQDDETRKRLGSIPAIFYSKSADNLINNIELFDAIDRSAKEPMGITTSSENVEKLSDRKTLSHKNGTTIINVEDILWIEADAQVAYIHLKQDEKKHIAKGTLKEIEHKLSDANIKFARISKKHIVNVNEISGTLKNHIDQDGRKKEVVEIKGSPAKLNIGRSYKQNLKKLLEEL